MKVVKRLKKKKKAPPIFRIHSAKPEAKVVNSGEKKKSPYLQNIIYEGVFLKSNNL